MGRRRLKRVDAALDTVNGIDASRRVGWAKYFAESAKVGDLESLNQAVLSVLFDLADAVLSGRSFDAFAQAWNIRRPDQEPFVPAPPRRR